MLKSLTVWNFALIEHAALELDEGLNILTGETGAGKSILIDALSVILGHRTSADNIRSGGEWFRIEAIFDISRNPKAMAFLDQKEIPAEADGALIVSRRLTKGGKNSMVVNGCHITLANLKALGQLLADMHGQHENQALLRPETQLALLDDSEPALQEKLAVYRTAFAAWQAASAALARQEGRARENAQRLDMLKWQTDEIAAARLKPGEDEALEGEIHLLSHAERIAEALGRAYQAFEYGGKNGGGVLAGLADIKKQLEIVLRYDKRLEPQYEIITDALYQLEDCSSEVRGCAESIDYSPERLEALQRRMDVIDKLRKKYGAALEDVLAHQARALQELEEIENYDDIVAALKRETEALAGTLAAAAGELTALRRKAAARLAAAIEAELYDLGMPKARFLIQVTAADKMTAAGGDAIEVLFSANAGEAPRPMQKIASGGELARIALAVKTVCAADGGAGTLVFDEIDAGIGGQTARMVAEKIARVALHKQVLCITHLPQIACMADNHMYIEKQADDTATVTKIKRLDRAGQQLEVARMSSGAATRAALDNAAQMLETGRVQKECWRSGAH